jgi:hypothetical protein
MPALALALALAAAAAPAPDLAPRVPRAALSGPLAAPSPPLLRWSEVGAATAGVLAADAAVLAAGYGTLRLFSSGRIDPTAANFRAASFGLLAGAAIVPPLAAALFATWARGGPASGAFWKSFLLAFVGNAAALAGAWALAPAFWAALPLQLATIPAAASLGLHWGPSPRALPSEARASPSPPSDRSASALAPAICPAG